MGMQVDRACTLTRAKLVSVGERVLQQFHDRDDSGTLVLDVLDRGAVLTNVAQQQCDSPAALGQLQRRVDRASDRLHIVLDAQQEAAHRFAALLLAGVQERRGGRLEPSRDDLVDETLSQCGVTGGQCQRHHHHTVLEALQVSLTVEGLQCVGRVVLERPDESREAELLREGPIGQRLDEVAGVLIQNLALVIVLADEVVDLLVLIVKENGVLIDVLQKVLPRSENVLVELNLAIGAVQIEHRVESVVIRFAWQRLR